MISYIRGELADVQEDKVIVDVAGVGYGVYMTSKAMAKLPTVGCEVKVHTYLNVREDAMQLFGFLNKDDLSVFRLLLGVSGIGPKGALGVLSALSADELRFAVMASDVKAISSAPGIGKKTAEKLIIELKDKLKVEDLLQHASEMADGDQVADVGEGKAESETVAALTALGYGSTEALKAVRAVPGKESMGVEELLKAALKQMI